MLVNFDQTSNHYSPTISFQSLSISIKKDMVMLYLEPASVGEAAVPFV